MQDPNTSPEPTPVPEQAPSQAKPTIKASRELPNFYIWLHLGKHNVVKLDPPSPKYNKSKYHRVVEALEYLGKIGKGIQFKDIPYVTDDQLVSAADHFKRISTMPIGPDGKRIRYVIPHPNATPPKVSLLDTIKEVGAMMGFGSKKGFTLVEVLICTVIIGVLAAVAMPRIHTGSPEQARITRIQENHELDLEKKRLEIELLKRKLAEQQATQASVEKVGGK